MHRARLVPAFATAAGQPGQAGLLVAVWSLGSASGGLVLSLLRNRIPLRAGYLLLLGMLGATSLPPRTAEAYGWLVTAGQIGSAIGSTVAGPLADHRAGGSSFLFVSAALLLALSIAMTRRRTLRSTVDISATARR